MIKLCSPDSMSNPYLVIAACLKAGIDGMENNMTLPDILKEEINSQALEGLEKLPESLDEALADAAKSEFIKNILGEDLYGTYIGKKQKEFDDYRKTVTRWEIDKYFIKY